MKKAVWITLFAVSMAACAQDAAAPPSTHGTVIFSRGNDSSVAPDQNATPTAHDVVAAIALTALEDSQRDAVTFTRYALDVHLAPADSTLAVHARMTVRNDGTAPLPYLPLQISSTLQWESIEIDGKALTAGHDWQQHALVTDADHTGAATEAVITLATPLAAGASVEVTAIYSGTITQSAERLERIGAPTDEASASEWDRITPEFTGLRGFGNVLWYPVAAPALFLGDGAKLFQAAGRMKLRESQALFSLRLTLEYTGATPSAVLLNGESRAFPANSDEAVAADAGVPRAATVEFPAKPMGFQAPSLFVVQAPLAPHDADSPLLAYTTQPELLAPYAGAAQQVTPLVTDWLGAPPPLALVGLPEEMDQPFEAGGMLALGLRAAQPSELTLQMAHALARAQLASADAPPRAWMDEGLAQFIALLWIEQTHGRQAAVDEMNEHGAALALAEPDLSAASNANTPDDAGQSLILATDEIYYRTKAADVWWMLRDMVGDTALQQALAIYHTEARVQATQEKEPSLFQQLLEKTSKKDLEWFFDDWVYRDHGLPDLSIAAVIPRQVLGKDDEYLVAVEVANDGYAAAEVPVTVRTGSISITESLLVPAREHATTRILFEVRPEEVQVNDGSVPELRATVHRKEIVLPSK
ncbi:MAG TPA: M1 family aminopeptidase [Acidobacteriaceae bacterium]|jgi:hypothetical protein|nr:M1 family aminopeptidase [Acidobacteriaceae bacterium]